MIINEKNAYKIFEKAIKKLGKAEIKSKGFGFWGTIETPYGNIYGYGDKTRADNKESKAWFLTKLRDRK